MAGGTGGHLFPAIAVSNYLRDKHWEIFWITGQRGLDRSLLDIDRGRVHSLGFSGVRRNGLLGWVLLPFSLSRSILASFKFIRRVKPEVVVGFGGYVTVPGGIAALLSRVPLLVHEQNAIAGLSNKLLSKFSNRVLLGFPNTIRGGIFIGNPLRPFFHNIATPDLRYSKREGPIRILVIGGSLGAEVLNRVVPLAIAQISVEQRPLILHQSGKGKLQALRNLYGSCLVSAKTTEFIKDMRSAYEDADLVISRAGALSVSEIAAAGIASIFVPYHAAVDDHQSKNAEMLERSGGAFVIQERDFTKERLVKVLAKMKRHDLMRIAEKAREVATLDATERAGSQIEEIVS